MLLISNENLLDLQHSYERRSCELPTFRIWRRKSLPTAQWYMPIPTWEMHGFCMQRLCEGKEVEARRIRNDPTEQTNV